MHWCFHLPYLLHHAVITAQSSIMQEVVHLSPSAEKGGDVDAKNGHLGSSMPQLKVEDHPQTTCKAHISPSPRWSTLSEFAEGRKSKSYIMVIVAPTGLFLVCITTLASLISGDSSGMCTAPPKDDQNPHTSEPSCGGHMENQDPSSNQDKSVCSNHVAHSEWPCWTGPLFIYEDPILISQPLSMSNCLCGNRRQAWALGQKI